MFCEKVRLICFFLFNLQSETYKTKYNMKQNKLTLALLALGVAQAATAQSNQQQAKSLDENAFTFTEAQLGEDQNNSEGVTILNSNTNAYASEVGYLFSPVRFRYRALNEKYNEIYINGAPVNDVERGKFAYSMVGGLNQMTRNVDFSLPFENNAYSLTGMAGSNNYDFRAGDMGQGHRVSVGAANRNYTLRGMYTYNSGFNKNGWAFSANLTYRWAKRGYVEGTFYNSLSYFLGVQKIINAHHRLAFSTWGNPTERASQGAATDESYWLANNYQYNPYWGYQNGKVRNSRVVNDYQPTALLTWDWKIDNTSKLTTSLLGKYGIYKSTKLNYNNSDNPAPDYWKVLPSTFYDVWNESNTAMRTQQNVDDWQTAVDYFRASKANRQINWDRLYAANREMNKIGADAMYYEQARHSNNLYLTLASAYSKNLTDKSTLNIGFNAAANKGMHYQTMDDLLGATNFHNINTYAIGNYSPTSSSVQYDLNHPNAVVKEGDKFGYDYNINVAKGNLWTSYTETFGRVHYGISAKLGYDAMQRDGKMRNGLFADNSYGKSKTARFVSGGFKFNSSFDLGRGHVFMLGAGYESKAPLASVAFQAAEMNNDYVKGLKNELVFSSQLAYQYSSTWLHANVSAYYNRVDKATEWTCFYFDDINSFSYNSLTDLSKEYYGLEAGAKVKLASWLDLKLLGTISQAKNISNAHVRYLNSTQGTYNDDIALVKNMHDDGTPLTATSIGLDYHLNNWYVSLNANYHDRIYLSYSPYYRYESKLAKLPGGVNEDGTYNVSPQDKGHGGWMIDGSIGKNIYLRNGHSLSFNLMVTNIFNNEKIVTGGYEQSRSDYTSSGNSRGYSFSKNPKKYYAFGTNGMFQISYRF